MGHIPTERKAKRPAGEEPLGSHSPDCRTCMPTYHPRSPVPQGASSSESPLFPACMCSCMCSWCLGRFAETGVARVASAAQTGDEGWRIEPNIAPSTSVYDSGRSEKMRDDRRLGSE
jgi:hypothetical protein